MSENTFYETNMNFENKYLLSSSAFLSSQIIIIEISVCTAEAVGVLSGSLQKLSICSIEDSRSLGDKLIFRVIRFLC